jgi:3-oxoacyl-(acyl-carrier-protein) synthase
MKELTRPGWTQPLRVRAVPVPPQRPSFLTHARLRRTSSIAQQSVGAALEALGEDASKVANGSLRLGVVLCVMSGCVNYSRRFYDEVLKDPGTASPLVFPETVFNAPASHLAALLGTTAINYTLVGDPAAFLQGLALAADWVLSERVEGCLVVGAEEMDWLTTDAFRLFARKVVLSDGAGALYLRRQPDPEAVVELRAVTQTHLFSKKQTRAQAARRAQAELGPGGSDFLLCDGLQGLPHLDRAEQSAWADWTGARLSPKTVLGEGLMAAAAWQCVAAVDALRQGLYSAANVSLVGCNQQAVAAQFVRNSCASS